MGRIICVTGFFPIYDKNGAERGVEFVVSHGIDELGRTVILPSEHPAKLGAKLDREIMEWVIDGTS